jgi:hypothetical protein
MKLEKKEIKHKKRNIFLPIFYKFGCKTSQLPLHSNTPKNPQPLEEELQTCKLLQSILYVQVKVAPTLQEQLIVSELPNRLVDIL